MIKIKSVKRFQPKGGGMVIKLHIFHAQACGTYNKGLFLITIEHFAILKHPILHLSFQQFAMGITLFNVAFEKKNI